MTTKLLMNNGEWTISNVPLGHRVKGLGVYTCDGILISAIRSSPYLAGLFASSMIEPGSHDWHVMESAWGVYK